MLEELQRLLANTHLSHRQIADETGISVSTLRGIKSGDKPNPTITTYQSLRDCLLRAAGGSASSVSGDGANSDSLENPSQHLNGTEPQAGVVTQALPDPRSEAA